MPTSGASPAASWRGCCSIPASRRPAITRWRRCSAWDSPWPRSWPRWWCRFPAPAEGLLPRHQPQLLGPPPHLIGLLRLLRAEALLFPGVAVGVVAVLLPEAAPVLGEQLDAVHPLGALPGVEMGDHQPHRSAVVHQQRLAVVTVREQGPFGEEVLQ